MKKSNESAFLVAARNIHPLNLAIYRVYQAQSTDQCDKAFWQIKKVCDELIKNNLGVTIYEHLHEKYDYVKAHSPKRKAK